MRLVNNRIISHLAVELVMSSFAELRTYGVLIIGIQKYHPAKQTIIVL